MHAVRLPTPTTHVAVLVSSFCPAFSELVRYSVNPG